MSTTLPTLAERDHLPATVAAMKLAMSLENVDNASQATIIAAAMAAMLATDVEASLGFTPANVAGDTFTGDVKVGTAGKGLFVKEGSNAKMGVATLVTGAKVVNTTAVTANSRIFLMAQSLGTITAPVALAVTARTASTSFTITSADGTDTSVIAWLILEPA